MNLFPRFSSLFLPSLIFILILSSCQIPEANAAVQFIPPSSTKVSASLAVSTPTQPPTSTVELPTAAPTLTPTPLPTDTPTSSVPSQAEKALARQTEKQCPHAHGEVDTVPFDSQGEGISEFVIYLPPCYNASPVARYPVLYFLHGLNNNDQQWVKLGAPAAADRLIRSGTTRPFIIVMPLEDSTNLDPDQTSFEDALINKLIPWIDQHYPTCVDRSCRAIGGLSRGSGWAIRIGLTDWQLFGAIGVHSVSPFDGDLNHLAGWAQLSSPEHNPRIYLDIGSYDQALPDANSVHQILTLMNVPHEWHVFDGGHNAEYWSEHITDYLIWYAQAWN